MALAGPSSSGSPGRVRPKPWRRMKIHDKKRPIAFRICLSLDPHIRKGCVGSAILLHLDVLINTGSPANAEDDGPGGHNC